jgi:hypothetical protein
VRAARTMIQWTVSGAHHEVSIRVCAAYEQRDLRRALLPTLTESAAEQRNLACLIALSALTTRRSGTYGAISK